MKLYIAGPMRNIPYFNRYEFERVEGLLRAKGFETFNPAEQDLRILGPTALDSPTGAPATQGHEGVSGRILMMLDIVWIAQNSDGLALLDGWENSRGARAEVAFANASDIPVRTYKEWLDCA